MGPDGAGRVVVALDLDLTAQSPEHARYLLARRRARTGARLDLLRGDLAAAERVWDAARTPASS